MKLIVGLGNPGATYEKTRHNAGFLAVDRLASRHAGGQTARARFRSLTLDVSLPGCSDRVMLMKPLTYMNLSGQAVAEAARFFKVEAGDIFVLVDDIALACGSIRVRGAGGAGGHNGLSSIACSLGTEEYPRCRIGVDAPGRVPQADYVLSRFSPEQWGQMEGSLNSAADAAETWAAQGLDAAMNRFNVREKQPPREERGDRETTG